MTTPNAEPHQGGGRVDRLGAFASTACAIHCALCAFLPATFAALGLDFLLGHEAEWALTLFAVSLGLVALVMGWRRHGKTVVLVTLSVGIIGLLAARTLEGGHHDGHHEGEAKAAVKTEKQTSPAKADTTGTAKHAAKDGHDSKDAHGSKEEHGGESHLMAELLGIGGGFILMFGHILNLGAMRNRRENQLEGDCANEC